MGSFPDEKPALSIHQTKSPPQYLKTPPTSVNRQLIAKGIVSLDALYDRLKTRYGCNQRKQLQESPTQYSYQGKTPKTKSSSHSQLLFLSGSSWEKTQLYLLLRLSYPCHCIERGVPLSVAKTRPLRTTPLAVPFNISARLKARPRLHENLDITP